MSAFGQLLRDARLRAGIGLRTFAELAAERASVVSAIETGCRAPWRRADTLHRVAVVLGVQQDSSFWQELQSAPQSNGAPLVSPGEQALCWWWTSVDSPPLDQFAAAELAEFVGCRVDSQEGTAEFTSPRLTELAIEWRVRNLLGNTRSLVSGAVDVEAALEATLGVRIEVVAGLIPRFSVQACVVRGESGTTVLVDRIVADSRPLANYRQLLATVTAPIALWRTTQWDAGTFALLRECEDWSRIARDCERFALAMQLPAHAVLAAAETAYGELVAGQGLPDFDDAVRTIRNRLAEQFAVPLDLVHRRLVRWPCHLYGRIAQALAAEEPTLPPSDWVGTEEPLSQRRLFDPTRA